MWIIVADERLALPGPVGHRRFLLWPVANLDQAAIFARGLHLTEGGGAHGSYISYLSQIVLLQFHYGQYYISAHAGRDHRRGASTRGSS